ncbi:MAG: hypothetical protein Q8O16_06920, partial [Dehalococcoidia bacterium]|nr:hypothetical protein [Dehalococcoidia bacterium]
DYVNWVADSDVTMTRETTEKVEGSASLKGVVAAGATLNDTLVYRAMATKDWTNGDTITFWLKAEVALDSNMTFALATGTNLQTTATQTQLINPTGTGWEKYTVTLSGGDDDSAAYFGIYLSTDAAGTFYLDIVQTDASFNKNADPLKTYANQVVFTVANVLSGQPIDFSTTSDADTDGIISDETTRTHKVIIYYSDQYQQVTDLAWTRTAIGKDDGDNLLEQNEKFQITVDLTYINNNAGWDFKKVDPYHPFTLELKPPTGGILVIERSMPNIIKDVNDLN